MGGEKPGRDVDAGSASTVGLPASGEHTMPASRESQPVIDLQPGGSIGRYKLISRLGAGAMGVVWCALDPQLDRKVAIKLVHGNLARSPEASNRLLREARAMAKLSHRAVVTVHDAGEMEGRLFLAMELVQGTTLGQMLRTRSDDERRDWRRWLGMMLEAGRGLAAAHGAGVLHRDFKPDNVLVDESGRVCVADFGLATLGDDHPRPVSERISKSAIDLTTTGALLGTPAYMSPQQLRGETIDARGDQFAFCVATYEALYGQRPFATEGTGLELLQSLEDSIVRGAVRPPPVESAVPPEVHDVLKHGLAANAEDRWPNMTTVLNALERARVGKRTEANTAIPAKRSHARLVALIAVVIAVLGAGAFVLFGRAKPVVHEPKKLYDVPLKTRLAVTKDGRRLVLTSDRLEVRELGGTRVWTGQLIGDDDVSHLQIEGDTVTLGTRRPNGVDRWHYETNTFEHVTNGFGVPWAGETVAGHLFYLALPGSKIKLHTKSGEIREWPTTNLVEMIAVSPDRRRVAIMESGRVDGEIVVRDVTRDLVLRSPKLFAPTALTWQDDQTILYATGATERPTIFRVKITDAGFGTPEVLYSLETGWFGELAYGGGRLFFIEMGPKSRARIVDRATQYTRELDAATVGAAMLWSGDDEFLIWNRNTKHVERRSGSGALTVTNMVLPAEPANATLAGDVFIAAVRGSRGREIVAFSMATGAKLWSLPPATALAVRCAGDRAEPCYALRRNGSQEDIVPIDSKTGAFGDKVIATNNIEDIAVNATGDRITFAPRSGVLHELASDGTVIATHVTPFSSVRSLTYDHEGGYFVAGTLVRNTFQVGRLADGKFTVIAQADNDLLSMVRPSHDGQRVLVHARLFAPMLWELPL